MSFIGECVVVLIILLDGLICVASFACAIANIVIGSKWDDCHLEKVDAYLISIGSLSLAYVVLWFHNKGDSSKNSGEPSELQTLAGIGTFGLLIWGMTIFYDSEQGDCKASHYNYAYYYTMIWMFFVVALVLVIILLLICYELVKSCDEPSRMSATIYRRGGNTEKAGNSTDVVAEVSVEASDSVV